jgi:hypothetical protein
LSVEARHGKDSGEPRMSASTCRAVPPAPSRVMKVLKPYGSAARPRSSWYSPWTILVQ